MHTGLNKSQLIMLLKYKQSIPGGKRIIIFTGFRLWNKLVNVYFQKIKAFSRR
jgi:hypothetical protein